MLRRPKGDGYTLATGAPATDSAATVRVEVQAAAALVWAETDSLASSSR
jgi:hypothetical protein